MKHSIKVGKPQQRTQTNISEPVTVIKKRGLFSMPRWLVLLLCLLVPAAGAVAVIEFVVWNWSLLPPALVGHWTVEGGPQDRATFDFSRSGSLEAHLNNNEMEHVLKGTVTVKDRTLFITTQNPNTGRDETRSCNIRELTETTLIVEFDNGEVFKMARPR